MNRTYELWVLDDNVANLAMIERSLPGLVRPALNVRSFDDASAFLSAFEQSCRSPQEPRPDFVLLDFFLGYTYGSQVLDRMRRTYEEVGAVPAVIIAHSSMPETSTLMVEQGADFALPKQKGQPTSPPITATFGSVEAIEYVRLHRRPMSPDVGPRVGMPSPEDSAKDKQASTSSPEGPAAPAAPADRRQATNVDCICPGRERP